MEELKLLVDMVAGLPQLALWVAVLFFGYKVVVVGSVYGVIRFVSEKIHDAIVSPARKEIQPLVNGKAIPGSCEGIMEQLSRVAQATGTKRLDGYLHADSVVFLREAIDDKLAKDRAK